MRLKDKAAIITGAGSGIGRASALLFAEEGAKVVVADWIAEGGKETVRLIKEAGGESIFVKVDVSKAKHAQRMVKTTIDKFGKLDILFNNFFRYHESGGLYEVELRLVYKIKLG